MAAKPRKTKNGKFELAVRHPSLPKGRKYFTFETYEEAERYAQQWQTLVEAGLPVPTEMLEKPTPRTSLGAVLRTWVNSGHASKTDQELGALLVGELGATLLSSVSYGWAKEWVQRMKARKLVPSTIRQRVGMVARALDHYQREHAEDMPMTGNPLRSLPAGYSAYSDRDVALAGEDGERIEDTTRDRRQLHVADGEHVFHRASSSCRVTWRWTGTLIACGPKATHFGMSCSCSGEYQAVQLTSTPLRVGTGMSLPRSRPPLGPHWGWRLISARRPRACRCRQVISVGQPPKVNSSGRV